MSVGILKLYPVPHYERFSEFIFYPAAQKKAKLPTHVSEPKYGPLQAADKTAVPALVTG